MNKQLLCALGSVYVWLLSPSLSLSLSEEAEGEEGGSFGLVKLIKAAPENWPEMDTKEDEEEEKDPPKQFSLDFPPGLVDVSAGKGPKRWRQIKKLLDERQKRK